MRMESVQAVSIIEEGFSIAGLLRLLLQMVQIWFLDKVKSLKQLVRRQILFVKSAWLTTKRSSTVCRQLFASAKVVEPQQLYI